MNTRLDPFREMDRFFMDAFRAPSAAPMPMDLYRAGEEFVARIDLPGVDPSSIDIDVEDRTLTIRAERRDEVAEGAQWLSHERPAGTFARQLTLGHGVAMDQIAADYSDGVLTLTIPMAEEAKPRKISVNHESNDGGRRALAGSAAE
ncbi:Hsp20/alpha crystallin family protein [Ornithinicoccus halotolerans]|uniref:Hsp20/alpha crystallin family protein n=1 Tax=Ornithinicoccus halotolerans TaxID=1748220 RepID=UPI001295630D|nr:Hsp20/alpha crystallin family protein [Ornithinicoccus halotolerans]